MTSHYRASPVQVKREDAFDASLVCQTRPMLVLVGGEDTYWSEDAGARMKALRVARAWTQPELASAAQCDAQYLSKIERGEKQPSRKLLQRLARALDVSVGALVGLPHDDIAEPRPLGASASGHRRRSRAPRGAVARGAKAGRRGRRGMPVEARGLRKALRHRGRARG